MAELRPSGFTEYSPAQQLIFDRIQKSIEEGYQRFWYTHIQTPAVERNDVLLAKNGEETGKQIFGLYGMAQGADDLKDYGLHFDLTVPFARYALDWEGRLTFPFKRYQIQPVWRGERPQKGRYREFTQCDIDVIWKGDKNFLYYDAEIIATLGHTLHNILQAGKVDDQAIFHINNKKIIKGFLAEITDDAEQAQQISTLIDKYTKIWQDNFVATLREDLKLAPELVEKIVDFVRFQAKDITGCEQISTFWHSELFQEGVEELRSVLRMLTTLQQHMQLTFSRMIDLQIVRGLDYYTGTIFEAVLEKDPRLGSICGGGSYANLTGYIDPKRNNFSGVGGSIGISRLMSKILEQEENTQQTIADYLFMHFEDSFEAMLSLAGEFASEGKSIEIYPHAEKLGKQFAYADKKGIPFVVIYGQSEKEAGIYKIKNMKTWEEESLTI